jgi:hypothetical protein
MGLNPAMRIRQLTVCDADQHPWALGVWTLLGRDGGEIAGYICECNDDGGDQHASMHAVYRRDRELLS